MTPDPSVPTDERDDRVFGLKCPELGPGVHDFVPKSRLSAVEQERDTAAKAAVDNLNLGVEARRERDENFGTIKTMCKVLCDLECENGCDEGLEYEGDEWCPCPCIYRHRVENTKLREERDEAARKADAYDVARSEVKIDGNTRAHYVLQRDKAWERAVSAEAENTELREALKEILRLIELPEHNEEIMRDVALLVLSTQEEK